MILLFYSSAFVEMQKNKFNYKYISAYDPATLRGAGLPPSRNPFLKQDITFYKSENCKWTPIQLQTKIICIEGTK
jgi:hypothetical protein